MPSDANKLLYDAAFACAAIRSFCEGHSAEGYQTDAMLQSACERQFEIIGEAMTRLRDLHPELFAEVPEGRDIIAFRNRLIHGYDTVDSEIVWDVIQTRLPLLERAVQDLLKRRG